MIKSKTLLSVLSVFFLAGCISFGVGWSLEDRLNVGNTLADKAKFTKQVIDTDLFQIVTFGTLREAGEPVTLYIEGDGLAWKNRRSPSTNPTPKDPLAFRLAVLDPSHNVIYMARPCQYTLADPACSVDYWTSHRYAPEVLNSVNQAINYIKVKYKVPAFNLVGFSGGGAIAAIIASQRSDILSLRTVAANLDHVALNAYHEVSQMPNSLNAADFARSVQKVPQVHFVGAHDEIVPEIVLTSFERRMTSKDCVTKHIQEGAGHTGGWTGHWQNLLKIEPVCINRTDPALHDAAAILGEDFGDEAIEDMADTDAGAIFESLEADIEPAILPEEKGADAPVSADEVSEKDAATPSTPDASTSEADAVEMPEATENSAQDALPDSTQGLDDLAEDSAPEDVAEELSFEELEAELNEYSEQLKAE